MSSPIVLAQHILKWYGPRLAVRDVSFSVAEGEVVGLLGPNGSGKSTIFRILTGYLTPSSGTASVAGHDVTTQSLAVRHEVGYVPEDAPLYDHMRVAEFLRFIALLKGLSGGRAKRAVEGVAGRLELEAVLHMPVAKLSRGYRQRVAIGQALLNAPQLLVLDEPTSGLDPGQVIAIRDLIRELAGRHTVLIASHVLSEIQQIANRVMILLDGRLLTSDALAQGAATMRLRLEVAGAEPEVRARIATVPGVRAVAIEDAPPPPALRAPSPACGGGLGRGPGEPIRYLVDADPRAHLAEELAGALVGQGFALSELTPVPPDLERIFLDLTRRPREVAA